MKRGSPVCMPSISDPGCRRTSTCSSRIVDYYNGHGPPIIQEQREWRALGNWKLEVCLLDDSAGVRIRHGTEAKTTSGKRDLKRGGIASVLGFFFRRRASTVYEDMRYESRSTQREMVSANLVAAAAARLRLVQNRTDRAGTCDSS